MRGFYGLDVSRDMLDTAAALDCARGARAAIVVAQADATAFDPEALFGRAQFERVMISYALSMIPPWREALARALDVVAPGGSLHLVDFGDCAGWPATFKAALRRWLAAFDVTPRDDLGETLAALAAARGLSSTTEGWRGGYATLAAARRASLTALAICLATAYIVPLRSWVVRQDHIPRGRTIPMGAVPALARGLWHTAPTYLRRRPGSPSNGRLGSALSWRELAKTL